MTTVLITGCDTGIGREFAAQYVAAGAHVIATYRDIANALPAAPTLINAPVDLTDFGAIAKLKADLGGRAIDILISNAAIGLDAMKIGAIDYNRVRQMFEINTIGALKFIETFVDEVARSEERRIVIISSRMGSMGANLSGGSYGYRASKAALNAIGRSLAVDLFHQGITVTMFHPGRAKTPGGGPGARLPVEDSVAGMRAIVDRMGNHETGQFITYAGHPLPW